MSLKNYIFSSINTKGAQDSDKFATIRLKSLKNKTMAVTSDENSTAQNRTETSVTGQTVVKTPDTNGTRANSDGEKFSCSWFFLGKGFVKVWSYITVEPLMLCWLLPSCFLFIAVENLALEKVRTQIRNRFAILRSFVFVALNFEFIFILFSSVVPCKFQL